MNRFYLVLGIVAVIAVGAVGYAVGTGAVGMGEAVTEPVELEGLDDTQRLVEMAEGIVAGNPDARVTIVEFGDYQCPGCAAFALQVKPQIDRTYLEAGTANFVYYDFPLVQIHPNAFLAARAARCAGDQNAYWSYHDRLFAEQQRWATQNRPVGLFMDYAEETGLDGEAFEACLKSDRHAATVTANMHLGDALGVQGTPTVMVSEGEGMATRLQNFDFESIREVVDEALADQEAASSEGDS